MELHNKLGNKYQYTTPWLPIPSISKSLGNFSGFLFTLDSVFTSVAALQSFLVPTYFQSAQLGSILLRAWTEIFLLSTSKGLAYGWVYNPIISFSDDMNDLYFVIIQQLQYESLSKAFHAGQCMINSVFVSFCLYPKYSGTWSVPTTY